MINLDGNEEPGGLNVQELVISDHDLQTMPEDLSGFKRLNHMDLANLCQLKICGTSLTTVPAAMCFLTSLSSLELVDNKLKDLPEELGQLRVTRFTVAGNQLAALPSCFYMGLCNVWDLDISRNLIESLETPPLCAAKLRSLDFSCNKVSALPEWLSTSCGALSFLSAAHNDKLRSMAGGTKLRKPLRHLDLTACAVSELDFFTATSNLVTLSIGNGVAARSGSGNCFWDFPAVILQCAATLRELSMRGTSLSQLPPDIGVLRSLVRLDLCDCELHTLPMEVGQLASLESLLLSNNKLVSLPDSVANLKRLRELCIDSNQIELLPEALSGLPKLVLLDLYDNKLDQWDDNWLNSLHSLQALDCELNHCSVESSERYKEMRRWLRLRLSFTHRLVGSKPEEDPSDEEDEEDEYSSSYSNNDLSEGCEPVEMPQFEQRKPESNWGSDDQSGSDDEWSPPQKWTTGSLQRVTVLWPPPIFPQKTFVQPNCEISAGQFMELMEN